MQKFSFQFLFVIFVVLSFQCSNATETLVEGDDMKPPVPLEKIKLPKGFTIELFATGIENARSMCLGEKGTIFVGTRSKGNVYAVQDTNGDYLADKVYTIAEGLTMPNGVAFKDGDLYVAEVNRIIKFQDIEEKLDNPPALQVVYDQFPSKKHHGWKYIAFGPDEKLYVPVGAPCNICESDNEIFASMTRMNPDGSGLEIFAKGIRNSVGFTWHPETKEMWFTDNGRDMLGDNLPPCELNHAPKKGLHFGYPYCHGGDTKDPKFGDKFPCENFQKPVQKLGAHVAPLGLKFYTGTSFPQAYRKQIFIAEHGSWNRSEKSGYRITLVKTKGNRAISYETFAEGWLDQKSQEAWGRPVDILTLEDGSILVSDDKAGVIYRIYYKG